MDRIKKILRVRMMYSNGHITLSERLEKEFKISIGEDEMNAGLPIFDYIEWLEKQIRKLEGW